MKITSAKRSREEIIRDRDEYDARKKALNEQHDAEFKHYRNVRDEVYSGVKDEVESVLSNFMQALNLDVYVSSGWRDNLEVTVKSNDHNVHDKNKALSWSWKAQMTEEGEVTKESGSWSGLQAVTEVQLESLRQSVACLEVLNSMDWATILGKELPNADDYIKTNPYEVNHNRPDFEQELLEAELDEIIGQDKLVEGNKNESRYYRGVTWYGIVSESAKMYKVFEVPNMYVEAMQEGKTLSDGTSTLAELIDKNRNYSYNTTKEKFLKSIVKPLNILEA